MNNRTKTPSRSCSEKGKMKLHFCRNMCRANCWRYGKPKLRRLFRVEMWTSTGMLYRLNPSDGIVFMGKLIRRKFTKEVIMYGKVIS